MPISMQESNMKLRGVLPAVCASNARYASKKNLTQGINPDIPNARETAEKIVRIRS
jgi:hypothetical protein